MKLFSFAAIFKDLILKVVFCIAFIKERSSKTSLTIGGSTLL